MSVLLLQVLFYLVCLCTQCTAVVQCVCCTSFDSALNVSDAPSTAGNILGTVVPNDCLLTTGCTDGWCSVTFDGQSAYTSHSYVSGPQDCGHPSDGSCLEGHCGGNTNVGRKCDEFGCGQYGAPRGERTHGGTDVQCSGDEILYAPFDGIMDRVAPPYGDGSCCDDGFEYVSTDSSFPNYKFKVFYASAHQIGTAYSKGDAIATHIGLHCGCYPEGMTDHSHVEIRINDVVVDPTSFMYCNYRS